MSVNGLVRRKVPTADGTPKYDLFRGGVKVGEAIMTGVTGRDNYPWNWYIENGVPAHHPRGKISGTASTLAECIDEIGWITQ